MIRAIPSLMVARWPPPVQFLLDTYPGALGAYSLRQLRTGQTNCIRVQKTLIGIEQDFGFVNGVLDTASLLTFLGSDSGYITIWYDQSGNGNNVSQTTSSTATPQIVDTGVVLTTNGKPTLYFGDHVTLFHYLFGPSGFLNGSTSLSYFHVAEITDYASSNSGVFGPFNSNSAGLEVLQVSIISRRTFLRFNGTARNDDSGAAYQLWDDATQSLTTILGNSSSVAAYKNSSAVSLTDSSAMPALNFNGSYGVGEYNSGTNTMKGYMQELVIYSTDQTANRAAIETNINAYYGIF